MARRKRKNEDLIDMMYEITEVFWQVGAVITAICTIGTLYSLDRAILNYYTPPTSPISQIVHNSLGWTDFLIPFILFVFTMLFGLKTYSAYKRQNNYSA